jgi:hypothetical protein
MTSGGNAGSPLAMTWALPNRVCTKKVSNGTGQCRSASSFIAISFARFSSVTKTGSSRDDTFLAGSRICSNTPAPPSRAAHRPWDRDVSSVIPRVVVATVQHGNHHRRKHEDMHALE